jgi:hypothetical protein
LPYFTAIRIFPSRGIRAANARDSGPTSDGGGADRHRGCMDIRVDRRFGSKGTTLPALFIITTTGAIMVRVRSILSTLSAAIVLTIPSSIRAQGPASSAAVERRVLVELYTGSWCGPCVTNADKTKNLIMQYGSRVIPVSIHIDFGNDAMATLTSDSIATLFGVHSIPTEIENRADASISAALASPAIAEITATPTYNASTRAMSVMVSARFTAQPSPGDVRLNVYVVEDSVVGSGYGYDQLNYYNKTTSSPYFGKGDHVVGYAHRNVLLAALSGAGGTSGVIPAQPAIGTAYERTYTYTLPARSNPARTRVVAFLSYPPASPLAGADVLNATDAPIMAPASVEPGATTGAVAVSIAPMPIVTEGRLHLVLPARRDITIELADMLGRRLRTVASEPMEAGAHTIPIDVAGLAGGAYSLLIRAGGDVSSRTIIIAH